MRIGLLSDTHSHIDASIFEHFKLCDEVWHAGDVGDEAILTRLQNFKPLRVVYGNIDTPALQRSLPENALFTCEGVRVLITHIGGSPPRYTPRVKQLLNEYQPEIFVCGHSHILRVMRDADRKLVYLNPGAAGNHGFHPVKTILRFEINHKQLQKMEVIELGKRGTIEKPTNTTPT